MAPSTALPISASANTTCGPLPPSSSITCLPAARLATEAPVSVGPTKPTPSTSGCPATSSPTSAPGPVPRLSAPAGKSAEPGHRRPRPVRGVHGTLRVRAGALWDLGDDLAGGRAVSLEELATLGLDPLTVDKHLRHGLGYVDGHLPGSVFVSKVEGLLVDATIRRRVHVPWVADRLGIGEGLVGQHRDLVFSEAKLLHARDVDVASQLVDVLDRHLRGAPRRHAAHVEPECGCHAREALG